MLFKYPITAVWLGLGLWLGVQSAQAEDRVALTFDDLPALTLLKSQPYVDYANIMILRGLKQHHLPAIGFVNEGKFDELDRPKQIENVERWLKSDFEIGNHTLSHESPNDLGAEGYIDEIDRGDTITRPMAAKYGKPMVWFRHPYLETGAPEAVKKKINTWLEAHHYRIAPVTMENSDWMFAEVYDDAIAHRDEAKAAAIRLAYLDYTDRMIGWYQTASRSLFNRDFSYIFLLHVTRLNADSMDALANLLKKHKIKAVTLEKAMRDPAYSLTDTYVGKEGVEWLERWSDSLKKPLPWESFSEPPADIQGDYKLIDPDH